jgi:hypothetical protein
VKIGGLGDPCAYQVHGASQTFHKKDSIAKPVPSGNLFVIILQTFQKKIASAHAPRMQPFCDHLACIPQKDDQ